jgi:hypothetical protein
VKTNTAVGAQLLRLLSHMDPAWWWGSIQARLLPVFVSSPHEGLRLAAEELIVAGMGCMQDKIANSGRDYCMAEDANERRKADTASRGTRARSLRSYAAEGKDRCSGCEKQGKAMKRCAACNFAVYCSRDCQSAHWRQHKQECKLIQKL